MTGLVFGLLLLVVVAAWFVLTRGRAEETSLARHIALSALAVIPTLLFGAIVLLAFRAAPAGEYRVALEAVERRLSSGEALTVGGGTEGNDADDLIIRDLPPGFLTFRLDGDRVLVELPEQTTPASDAPRYAAVRVGAQKPFFNSIPLAAARTVRITTRDGEVLTLNTGDRTLSSPRGTLGTIPVRTQNVGPIILPVGRNLDAETSMYPIRFLARPATATAGSAAAQTSDAGGFISWDGGFFRNQLFITLPGDGSSVEVDGVAKQYSRSVATITAGQSVAFALYRLDYADPLAGDEGRSLAQERRSFRASLKGDRLSLVFDSPDVVRLSPKAIERLVEKEKDKSTFLLATRDASRNAPIASNQMVLSFPQLGPRIQNEFFSLIRVSGADDCALRVLSHKGVRCHPSGDAFRIGDQAAAVLRITKVPLPWGIVLTMFALAPFSLAWMWRHSDQTIALIAISAAEVLLAVRLLIAFEGAMLDRSVASALWESLVIFALVPYALRVVATLNLWRNHELVASLRSFLLMIVESVVVISLSVIALMQARVDPAAIAAVCAAALLVPVLAGSFAPVLLRRFTTRVPAARTILLLGLAIIVVRLAMWLFLGWKERISLGGADLAVTVLYLPVVFLFFGFLWDRYRIAGPATSRAQIITGVLYAAIGVFLMLGIPVLVKDSGSAFVHVPAVALFFALPALAAATRWRVLLAVPLLLMLLGHAVVFVSPWWLGRDDVEQQQSAYQAALSNEAQAEEYLQARLQRSTNELRVISSMAPNRLAKAGTSKAEGLVMQRRMLDRYGGRGFLGAGYLNVPLTFFRDTHLNDNLSAIHLLAPFGAMGAMGIIGLLVALALLPVVVLVRGRGENENSTPEALFDSRTALGTMALWTFSLCGIYMVAANLGLVLFTGKNVYLLAASSKSDAVEGWVLLVLGLIALSPGTRVADPPQLEEEPPLAKVTT